MRRRLMIDHDGTACLSSYDSLTPLASYILFTFLCRFSSHQDHEITPVEYMSPLPHELSGP